MIEEVGGLGVGFLVFTVGCLLDKTDDGKQNGFLLQLYIGFPSCKKKLGVQQCVHVVELHSTSNTEHNNTVGLVFSYGFYFHKLTCIRKLNPNENVCAILYCMHAYRTI